MTGHGSKLPSTSCEHDLLGGLVWSAATTAKQHRFPTWLDSSLERSQHHHHEYCHRQIRYLPSCGHQAGRVLSEESRAPMEISAVSGMRDR